MCTVRGCEGHENTMTGGKLLGSAAVIRGACVLSRCTSGDRDACNDNSWWVHDLSDARPFQFPGCEIISPGKRPKLLPGASRVADVGEVGEVGEVGRKTPPFEVSMHSALRGSRRPSNSGRQQNSPRAIFKENVAPQSIPSYLTLVWLPRRSPAAPHIPRLGFRHKPQEHVGCCLRPALNQSREAREGAMGQPEARVLWLIPRSGRNLPGASKGHTPTLLTP
ncbi:hypothetical protein B0T22DRAFT_464569 [Podospora appendiculata]|uniref:Uncharacterized protein n=1 Tax=Podospora appendiculata TaxID=314037 RepID=A0AAE0X4D8_9PEZI|nr:hypothetical protein B0T22DRAFT_464569 [Podospora appendiculata]